MKDDVTKVDQFVHLISQAYLWLNKIYEIWTLLRKLQAALWLADLFNCGNLSSRFRQLKLSWWKKM